MASKVLPPVRVEPGLQEALAKLAEGQGRTLSDLIRDMLRQGVLREQTRFARLQSAKKRQDQERANGL